MYPSYFFLRNDHNYVNLYYIVIDRLSSTFAHQFSKRCAAAISRLINAYRRSILINSFNAFGFLNPPTYGIWEYETLTLVIETSPLCSFFFSSPQSPDKVKEIKYKSRG